MTFAKFNLHALISNQFSQADEEAEKKLVLEQIKYKMHLDQQMDDKQEEINQKYKEFLKEKTLIDEIIQQFKAEQRKITIEAMVKKQVAQEEIQEFIDSQKIFVIRENERNNAENEAIKAFIVKKDAWKEVNTIFQRYHFYK